ncbi:MAG TPA: hypothetical protein PKN32_04720 [Bacteroidales bacterium]|nr:hypothetical protein [Bacteroidales bacterium]
MKFNLIIPSAGEGKRFIHAGYRTYKPFIDFLGETMLSNVIRRFPLDVRVIVIASESKRNDFSNLNIQDNIEIMFIKDHKKGPAFSVYCILEMIKPDESYFISYNDIIWNWKFDYVKLFIENKNPDGMVFTHYGFHPHLYKNNFSAFCKVISDAVVEIREKNSFTGDWMNEFLSVGVFYFKEGAILKEKILRLIEDDNRIAGEYYPSVVFNYLINDSLIILKYDITNFVHIGLPEQLEDALHWQRVFKNFNLKNSTPVCMMMCGTGERMKAITNVNKSGINVFGKPMFEYVLSRINSDNNLLLVNDCSFEFVRDSFKSINIHSQTPTQTASLKMAVSELSIKKDLLITSNDCFGIIDYEDLKNKSDADIVIFGFIPSLLQKKQDSAHTYFLTKNEFVSKILIKQKVDSGFGLAGMFYLPDCSILNLLDSFDELQNPSLDHFVKYLLGLGKSIKFTILEDYVHIGTPEEYQEFIFWQKYYE